MLYGTSKRHLKNLSKSEREQLSCLARACGKLYNCALTIIQQEFERTGSLPTFATLFRKVEQTPEYQKLGKPFRHAVGLALDNCTVSIKKGFPVPKQRSRKNAIALREVEIKDRKVCVPATTGTTEMWLPVSEYDTANDNDIFRVFIVPRYGGTEWDIITRRRIKTPVTVPMGACVGIDLGVSNFLTLACSNGDTLIVDGRRLKSIYQKEYKRRREKGEFTKANIQFENKVDDYLCKAAAIAIDFCKANGTGKVLIGKGDTDSRQRVKMRVRSLWPDYPYTRIKNRLLEKCQQAGIRVLVVDEAWTSKASFIDNDGIPSLYEKGPHDFSGTRRYRGLYVSKDKYIINADVNGALNILRKHNACDLSHLQKNPFLIRSPKRIDPLTYKPNGYTA